MRFRVNYNYLPTQFGNRKDIFDKWQELALSGEFTLGPYVEKFENEICSYLDVKHCISTNTGTDALVLSLKSLGVGDGHEVITVSNTFYATVGSIVSLGAKPIFVDVDERFQLNAELLHKAINRRTKAILPVYWAGSSPDMDSIVSIASQYGLPVIADACMAIGGTYNGKSPANWGDIAAYSMHPLKSLNVMGDGGFITTNNHELADWLRKYRNHGMINRNEIEFYGVNSRLQPTQAIVASIELSFLDEYISKRKRLASLYDRGLSVLNPHIKIPPRNNQDVDTYSLYIIQCQNRDRLLSYLQSKGIEAKIHYPIPLHEQQAHKLFAGDEIELENTSKQAKHILTLPCHQYLNDDDIQFVIKAIKDFYEE